jgi:hypothetical protein
MPYHFTGPAILLTSGGSISPPSVFLRNPHIWSIIRGFVVEVIAERDQRQPRPSNDVERYITICARFLVN